VIKKAVIPVAGKGTRLMPMTSILPKALFPLINAKGQIKSALQVILELVHNEGIENVALIHSPGQYEQIQRFLSEVVDSGPSIFPKRVQFIEQSSPSGFGHAVSLARDFVDQEDFLLLLSDHIQIPDPGEASCLSQVIKAHEKIHAKAMIGMHRVSEQELQRVGVATGQCVRDNIYQCTNVMEKPTLSLASQALHTKGLPENEYLAHCGLYIFNSEIFSCLEQVAGTRHGTGQEIEMAEAQRLLLQRYRDQYFLCQIRGRAYDMGTPDNYISTLTAYRDWIQEGV
jgi:UTP--glucose-1-phosphate uridylyltransferase